MNTMCKMASTTAVLGCCAAYAVAAQPAYVAQRAGAYPAKSVRMIVPFETGSTTDTLARIVGRRLTDIWAQPVVVDNRVGAGGNVDTDIVAKAAPDGYTLLMAAGSHAINPSLYRKLPYDMLTDFSPITLVATAPQILIMNPSVQASTVKEFIALAKSRPGELNYASGGSGSPSHLTVELFKSMAGIDIVHVPYKGGGPVLTALLSGDVQLYAGNIRAMMSLARAGRLKALAVTSAKRSSAASEVPTVAESGLPGFNVTAWWGLLAPARTAKPIVDKLQREVAGMLNANELRERLAADAIDTVGSNPDQFDTFIRKELVTWAKVVKASGARVD